jgi:hypothetical protein
MNPATTLENRLAAVGWLPRWSVGASRGMAEQFYDYRGSRLKKAARLTMSASESGLAIAVMVGS